MDGIKILLLYFFVFQYTLSRYSRASAARPIRSHHRVRLKFYELILFIPPIVVQDETNIKRENSLLFIAHPWDAKLERSRAIIIVIIVVTVIARGMYNFKT